MITTVLRNNVRKLIYLVPFVGPRIRERRWEHRTRMGQFYRLTNPHSLHRVSVGEFTYGDVTYSLAGEDESRLEIGKFCSIAGGVIFLVAAEHAYERVATYPFRTMLSQEGRTRNVDATSKGSVIVGNDVWLGVNCIVLSVSILAMAQS